MVSCLNEICALVSVSGDVTAVEEIITPPDLCSLHSDRHSLQSQLQCYLNLKMKLMNSDSKLETIYRRCRNRPLEDKKVAPGSNLVQRTALDVRYLLSLLCLNIGQLEELQENTVRKRDSPVIHAYREAITWFPRSIEGGFALGTALRHIVTTEDELLLVQEFWEKGWIGAQQSISSISSECQCSLCQQNIQRLNDRIISRARDASQQLRSSLILHYCQAGRMDLATPLLVAGRFVLVLSQEILHYPLSASASVSAQETRQAICSNAMGVDNILPAHYLRRLQSIFRSQSPFWSEHHYDFFSNASRSVGYFSYLYHFRDSAATAGPKNVIEQVIQRIYQVVIKKFPEVESEATVAEWWVHSRPHSCGHQFHFDSDETAIYAGKAAQHPIISCVLYLSEDHLLPQEREGEREGDSHTSSESRSIGGPTVVTDQTLQSEGLATHGFMFHPKENRLVAFDSKYLHGVIPGRGVCPGPPESRRVTFMVGFWRHIQAKTREGEEAGPGQPFPALHGSRYTWQHEVSELEPSHESDTVSPQQAIEFVPPIPVPKIWQPVHPQTQTTSGGGEHTQATLTSSPPYNSCFQGF